MAPAPRRAQDRGVEGLHARRRAPWWLDDHDAGAAQVGTAFLEQVRDVGPKIVAVHKGFGRQSAANHEYASPVDVGPAAKANPDINFVVYHSGYEPGEPEGPYTDATADVGVNRLITSAPRRRHRQGRQRLRRARLDLARR